MIKSKSSFDDSSDDTNNQSDTELQPPTTTKEDVNQLDHDNNQDKDYVFSIHSDVTKHAELLEKDMDSAMADLKDPETSTDEDPTSNEQLINIILQLMQPQLDTVLSTLASKEKELQHATETCNKMMSEFSLLNTKIKDITETQDRLNKQLNFVSRQVDQFDDRFNMINASGQKTSDKVYDRVVLNIESHLQESIRHSSNTTPSVDESQSRTLLHKQDKVQRRLRRLKEGTKTMFN